MKFLFVSLLFASSVFGYCQDSLIVKKDIAPLLGYQQFQKSFVEAGIAKVKWSTNGLISTMSYGLAGEIGVTDKVYGVKTFFRSGGSVNVGFNLIYYGEYEVGKYNTLRFRPEIGLGSGFVNLIYGYNLPITHSDFKGINTHMVTLQFIFSPKMLKQGLL